MILKLFDKRFYSIYWITCTHCLKCFQTKDFKDIIEESQITKLCDFLCALSKVYTSNRVFIFSMRSVLLLF